MLVILDNRKIYKYVGVSSTNIGGSMKENLKIKDKDGAVEAEKKDFLEDLQRVQADFENYIKRVEKEKEGLKLHAKSGLLLKLISIKEGFERAIENTKDAGIKMIYQQLKKILEEEDVKEIDAVGKDFDYVLHEVVKTVESEENKIIEEIQRGYLIGDKVLRTSKVILGKNENRVDRVEVKENE